METLLNRYRNLTVLLLVIFAQLVLLAYQVKSSQDVRLIRVWSVTAVTPMAKFLEILRANTIGVAENYFVLVGVRGENRRLKEEVDKLKLQTQFLRSELETADRMRALQAFQARTPSKTIPARIIGTGTGANARVVYVDQGSGKGVMRGMAVITADGIVGKVLAAYPTASQVLLITDSTFAAGVISDKNRVHGTVKGRGESKCIVDYVQNEEKVESGEMFYTSGDDRVFPKGMPVGKVSVVREGRRFKEIYLTPSGFQQGLDEVLIVVEGVHQQIPDALVTAAPQGPVYVLPPPDQPTAADGTPAQPQAGPPPTLQTDADRLRERYKRIGEAQGHTFGEGTPGSKPPDFRVNPDAAKPAAPAPGVGTNPGAGGGPATQAVKPQAAAPNGNAATAPAKAPTPAQPKPSTNNPSTGGTSPVAAPKPNGASTTAAKPAPQTVKPPVSDPKPVTRPQPTNPVQP